MVLSRGGTGFPRLYAAASLKRHRDALAPRGEGDGFPRLYAAASLKLLFLVERIAGVELVFRGFMPRPH